MLLGGPQSIVIAGEKKGMLVKMVRPMVADTAGDRVAIGDFKSMYGRLHLLSAPKSKRDSQSAGRGLSQRAEKTVKRDGRKR
jgi:hypothetical protein